MRKAVVRDGCEAACTPANDNDPIVVDHRKLGNILHGRSNIPGRFQRRGLPITTFAALRREEGFRFTPFAAGCAETPSDWLDHDIALAEKPSRRFIAA